MLSLLEFLLILAVVIGVGVKIWVIAWKLRLAIRRAVRKITEYKVVAFAVKIGMFLYFSLVVASVDRALD